MSGLDFGAQNAVLASCGRKTVDIVLNEGGKRYTPTMVVYTRKDRLIGTKTIGKRRRFVENTADNIKRIVGVPFDTDVVREDAKHRAAKLVASPEGNVAFKMKIRTPEGLKRQNIRIERIMAMILRDVHMTDGCPGDVAIAVPQWYSIQQRTAVLDACKIAKVNAHIVDETSALAFTYSLKNRMLIPGAESEPTNVLFVDMGHSSTQFCLAKIKQGFVEINQTRSLMLGGEDFTANLAGALMSEFKDRHPDYAEDITKKSVARMEEAAEHAKVHLSTNTEADIFVENIVVDFEYSAEVTRDFFEEINADLFSRFEAECASLKNELETIDSIVIVGGSIRIPKIMHILTESFGLELKRTLNQEESIATGAALYCANLLPRFHVTETKLKFPCSHDVILRYGEDKTVKMFSEGEAVPETKAVPVSAVEEFQLEYGGEVLTYTPQKFDKDENTKLRVTVHFDGMASVTKLEVVQKEFKTIKVPKKKDEGSEESSEESSKEEEEEMEEQVKTVVTKTQIGFTTSSKYALPAEIIEEETAAEDALREAEMIVERTADARNRLETTCYNYKNYIEGEESMYFTDKAQAKMLQRSAELLEWLYNEGRQATLQDYEEKLAWIEAPAKKGVSSMSAWRMLPVAISDGRAFLENPKTAEALAQLKDTIKYDEILKTPVDNYQKVVELYDKMTEAMESANFSKMPKVDAADLEKAIVKYKKSIKEAEVAQKVKDATIKRDREEAERKVRVDALRKKNRAIEIFNKSFSENAELPMEERLQHIKDTLEERDQMEIDEIKEIIETHLKQLADQAKKAAEDAQKKQEEGTESPKPEEESETEKMEATE
ncbi:hypothetical protein PCE1_003763 [Barthelona sp. PCE]